MLLAGRIEDMEGCRFPMDWNRPLADRKKETFELYQRLSSLKKNSKALQQGGFKVLYARGSVFVCARFTEDEAMLFCWSVSAVQETLRIEAAEFGFPEKPVSILINSGIQISSSGCAGQIDTVLYLTLAPHGSGVVRI